MNQYIYKKSNSKKIISIVTLALIITLLFSALGVSANAASASETENLNATASISETEIETTLDIQSEALQNITPFAAAYSKYTLRVFYYSSLRTITLGNPDNRFEDTVSDSKYNSQRTFNGLLGGFLESGYKFIGWYTEKDGGGRKINATDLVYTAETFSEQIDESWNSYADHLHRLYAHYEPIVLPPNPTKEHHDFEGWYLDSAFTQKYVNQGLTQDTTLYAKFIPKTYKITFATGFSGISVSEKSVAALTGGGTVAPIEKTGYIFKGWFFDSEKKIPYNPETPITGDTTVYADWEIAMINVTFLVDGEVYTTVSVPWGSTLTEAVTAAQSQSEILSALYSDINLHNALSVNTVLTSDMNIHAELSAAGDETGVFENVGNWFSDNWLYFPIAAGCVLVGMLAIWLTQKKRGVV